MWLQVIPPSHARIGGKDLTIPPWATMADRNLKYYFFDITTDLEVPVVCCVRVSPQFEREHTLVSCAAGFHEGALIDSILVSHIRGTVMDGCKIVYDLRK